jgi:hypothetical protein
MLMRPLSCRWIFPLALLIGATPGISASWTKQTLDTRFLTEGITAGDINQDGKLDIVSGPYWFEGPAFTRKHQIYAVTPFVQNGYANNNHSFVYDFNHDGWPDIFVCARPGEAGAWYENPGTKDSIWIAHPALDSVDDESPQLVDMFGDGKRELVMVTQGHVGWASPPADPTQPWIRHNISPANPWYFQNTHGLGVGDVSGDGRKDILMSNGWYEQPAAGDTSQMWRFRPYAFFDGTESNPGGAQMVTYDVDGDGDADIVTSLDAHGFGLAWFEQIRTNGNIDFIKHMLVGTRAEESKYGLAFSELHALAFADVDGNGLPDIITGKRWWAHGPTGDVEPDSPAVIYAFLLTRTPAGPVFTPSLIDTASGVGTQITAVDLDGDGKAEVLSAARKGIFVFHYQGPAPLFSPTLAPKNPKGKKTSFDFLGRLQKARIFLPTFFLPKP